MNYIGIVGAGITGVTTAYYLARKGHKVVVYDKHPYSAMHTSYANGGQLSVSNAEVWTNWTTVKKGIKWMFRKDAPLLFNMTPSIPKYKWVAGFLLNTLKGQSNFDKHTLRTIETGLDARELYYAIAAEEGIEFDLLKQGILHFYRDETTYQAAIKSCSYFQKAGVDRHVVTADEVVDIDPALAPIRDTILGGTYTPGDASGDIHKFCIELSKVLVEKYGVIFHYDSTVNCVAPFVSNVQATVTHKGEVRIDTLSHLFVCSGVDSERIANMVSDSVGVYPIKGYSITVPLDTHSAQYAPTVSLLDEATKIVSSRLGDRLRVAGTAELADWNYDIRQDRIKPLVDWVRTCFPQVNVEHAIPWAGLRPMTTTMYPVVRKSKHYDRVIFNTGHGHLGWTLGASTAQQAVELLGETL